MSGSRSLPSTPLGSRTPRHSGGSPASALSSPGGDLRLHQMIAVQGWMGVSLSFPYPYTHILYVHCPGMRVPHSKVRTPDNSSYKVNHMWLLA